jgi:DNA replication and repair protein RecF
MYITKISLENYKNLNLTLHPKPGLNLVIAPNGAGKTNLLEAINYLAEGSSFRGINDEYIYPHLLKKNEVSAVQLNVASEGELTLRVAWQRESAKTFFFNDKRTNLAKVKRSLRTLVHAPDTLDFVAGAAGLRRDFLDRINALLSKDGKISQTKYRKVTRQKNSLLKAYLAGNISEDQMLSQLNFWNRELAHSAAIIAAERLLLLELIFPLASEIAGKIYDLSDYEISYAVDSKYITERQVDAQMNKEQLIYELKANLAAKLEANKHKESRSGKSLYGPHRDDFQFKLNGGSVRYSCSRGQQRLFSLILHLAVLRLLNSEYQTTVILLLDDILSELDPQHRLNTIKYLDTLLAEGTLEQIFLTSPDDRDFSKMKTNAYMRLSIN